MYKITEEGKKYLERGLPEKQLIKLLDKKGEIKIKELKKKMDNPEIGINWAKKRKWIRIKQDKIELVKKPNQIEEEKALKKISKGEKVENKIIEKLENRDLIEEIREDVVKRARKQLGKEISNLTPELIKTGLWRKAKFKQYDAEKTGKRVHPGKKHILTYFIQKIRRIFLEMGFEEREGSFVESSFWNFDALFQPQDHPARDMHDTLYLKTPQQSNLPDKTIVEAVKRMHKKGDEESKGWGYKWKRKIAERPVLRTHTTAVTVRSLRDIKPPAKVFSVGRVFRNETLDYSHLPEFGQVEGIVVDENVTFRDLLGYLKEFYKKLGFKKIRFRPSYFPYTEMSVEPELYFKEKDEWLELGGAGIFRPEVTKPLGIDVPVLAWGLGLERPIMLKLGINDIRKFYFENDLKFLREVKV